MTSILSRMRRKLHATDAFDRRGAEQGGGLRIFWGFLGKLLRAVLYLLHSISVVLHVMSSPAGDDGISAC